LPVEAGGCPIVERNRFGLNRDFALSICSVA
jgi:hypothetical protein